MVSIFSSMLLYPRDILRDQKEHNAQRYSCCPGEIVTIPEFEFLHNMHLAVKASGGHGHMDFLAHVQGSDQGIAHPPSHPLLLVEQPSCPDGSRLLGDVHL